MGTLMLEIGGRRFDGGNGGRQWIAKGGLDDWWDGAEPTYEEQADPSGDGAYDPVTVNVGPRRVNIKLIIDASSPAWASNKDRAWAAALAKKTDVGFRVYESGVGWRSLRSAKIRGVPKVRPHPDDLRLTIIDATIWSADPRKYGTWESIDIDAIASEEGGLVTPLAAPRGLSFGTTGDFSFPGVFRLRNPGTADYFPIFSVRGPIGGFSINSGTEGITFDGEIPRGKQLILSPYAGGRAVLDGVDMSHLLTRADWLTVDGEQERGFVFSPVNPGGGAQLTINYPPDGAYW
ncbi:MAG: hypothetical protein IJO71_09145 [Microbacterium sp.]|uniref:hypothetical protein n=1 Tax=Microbacterium sp. TaxID=51671 RepID=UPI0025D7F286|nr:hypothetical protein [Microbacterium sp.]MBQ9917351.1 hypothetical protein [Microbacterium sp.]